MYRSRRYVVHMSIYTLLGFAVLAAGAVAMRFLDRIFKHGQLGRVWTFAQVVALVASAGLGIAAVVHSRYPTPDVRLLGFPFLAAAFERSPTGGWTDFVGVLTLPAMVGNFLVGFFIPQVFIAMAVWFCLRKNNVQ